MQKCILKWLVRVRVRVCVRAYPHFPTTLKGGAPCKGGMNKS